MPGPITSDLIFSEQANHNFSKTLGELKRSTLSIRNRLQSIREDAAFAERVAAAYGRPLIANERCGSWYIDPQNKFGSAYFKSTDGHTGVWKFSSRRLNLHLLEVVGQNDGCIIVDSTRRGKRMPDALSKTIPIWCSVLNHILFPEKRHELYTPPQVVSQSEHAQIDALLPIYIQSLRALEIPTESLRSQISKPLRPIWITPDMQLSPADEIFPDFHPVICCTVSRRVPGGEMSEGGYIQGAGDDTENWAHGLTPITYWRNQKTLLSTPEADLRCLIESMMQLEAGADSPAEELRRVRPTSLLFVGRHSTVRGPGSADTSCVIRLLSKVTEESGWQKSQTTIEVGLGPHKIGSRNLRAALSTIIGFVRKVWMRRPDCGGEAIAVSHPRIIVTCETGKDHSIGVVLALLCLFFDEGGQVNRHHHGEMRIDKTFIRQRLGWISTSMPDANPSRATLQSVNSFLMDRP